MVDIDGTSSILQKTFSALAPGRFRRQEASPDRGDAKKFAEENHGEIRHHHSDLPSPIEKAGLSPLQPSNSTKGLKTRFESDGIFCPWQAGSGNLLQIELKPGALRHASQNFFESFRPYYAYVPSFDVPWAFLIARTPEDPARFDAPEADRRDPRTRQG